jgi:hypothetical protein
MSLLDLKTDLKSLKYGSDQPGGGDSGQPFIKTDINSTDATINRIRLTKFDDGLVRGGIIGATNAAVTDTIRISKFLYTDIKGPLFIVKQIGLQLSNPRLEVPKNFLNIAAGGLDNVLSVGTNGLLQPTRIYNLGINTLAQVPINAIGGHINRHGLLPVQSDASKYEAVVTANNNDDFSNNPSKNNRLVTLVSKFKLGDTKTNKNQNARALQTFSAIANIVNTISSLATGAPVFPINLKPEDSIINKYYGGPDSTYGIGNTIINRSSYTEDGYLINKAIDQSSQYAGKTRDKNGYVTEVNYNTGLSKDSAGNGSISNYDFPTGDDHQASAVDQTAVNYKFTSTSPSVKSYAALQKQIDQQQKLKNNNKVTPIPVSGSSSYKNAYYNQFGIYDTSRGNAGDTDTGNDVFNVNGFYSSTNVEQITYKNSYGDVITINKKNWDEVSREKRVGSGRQDQINLTPIFSNTSYWYNDTVTIDKKDHNIRDLVKFAIQAVDTDSPSTSNFMIFRAYLTSFSDNVDSQWTDINYVGRGNPFYVYKGFTRKIQIGFKVAALSVEEMQPMYSKLNYLMANLMPDYKDNIMRGPLTRITVGNYLDAQLGKLDSLSYTIPNDSPWEIAIDEPEGGIQKLILPHIIEVSMNFTPIGADTKQTNKIEAKNGDTSFLAQNSTGADAKTIQYYNNFFNKSNII